MVSSHHINKGDFKRFRICFKLVWINKEPENAEKVRDLKAQKQICLKTSMTRHLTPPFSIDNAVSDFKSIYADGGKRVGQLARDWFKTKFQSAFDLENYCFAAALELTPQLIGQKKYDIIFEPAFQFQNYRTKVDILIRNEQKSGWKLIEVKAKSDRVFTDKGKKSDRLDLLADLSYQFYVLTKCHIQVTEVSLLLLRHDYILLDEQADPTQLFIQMSEFEDRKMRTVPFIDYCRQQQNVNESLLEQLNQNFIITKNWSPKKILLTDQCFNQGQEWQKFFHHCPHVWPYVCQTGSVFDLCRAGVRSVVLYYEYGIKLMTEIPLNFQFNRRFKIKIPFTSKQRRQITATKNPTIVWKEKGDLIQAAWRSYKFPLYFYDFESFQTPIPVYRFTCPYQQVVFQYSLHVVLDPDQKQPDHFEYIAPSSADPRLAFIKQLTQDCFRFGVGSYVVYNKTFECNRLKELIDYLNRLLEDSQISVKKKKDYLNYIDQLQTISDHTIDLMIFFSTFYIYKPEFHGKWSIKKILPVLVPALSYDHLPIQKGDQASECFYRLVTGNLNLSDWQQDIVPALRKYCAQDSLAMVKIWHKLREILQQENIITG